VDAGDRVNGMREHGDPIPEPQSVGATIIDVRAA
jgi:hypothetical protein